MKTRVSLAIALLTIAAIGLYLWTGSDSPDEGTPNSAAAKVISEDRSAPAPNGTLAQDRSSIDGRVVQTDGQVLAGASIQLVPQGERSERLRAHDAIVTSSQEGRFRLNDIPPGGYVLSASAAGFLPGQRAIRVEASKDVHELVLKLEAGGFGLSGEVSDLTGGMIAAAIVHVLPMSTNGIDREHSASAQTDEAGQYKLSLPPGRYLVQALHTDYVPKSQVIEVTSAAQTLNFGLAPGAVIEGVVRHIDSDERIAGALVSYATERVSRVNFFSDSVGGGSVRADDRGHFRITGLNSGSLQLNARGDNAATTETTRVALGIAEQRTDVELYLSNAFRVSGKVVDEATKEAIAGIQVSASSEGNRVLARALSNDAGEFEITGLSHGEYRLDGEGGEYLQDFFGDKIKVETNVDDALLELTRGAMILGRVEPAGVAEIGLDLEEMKGLSPNAFRGATSAPDGSFALGPLEPASFRIQAKGEDGALGHLDVVLPRTGLHDVVIAMKDTGSVSGQVVDASGAAVSDLSVKLRRRTPGRSMGIVFNGQDMMSNSSHTGPDGSFQIKGLKNGDYDLRVVDAQGETLRWADAKASDKASVDPRTLTIANQQAREGLLLRVENRDASITGTVTGPDGNSAPDVWVTASATLSTPMGMPAMPSPDRPKKGAAAPGGGDSTTETRSTVMMVLSGDGGGEDGGPGLDLGRGGELPPVLTDDKGQFRIDGLRAGTYNLIAEGLRGTARGFVDDAKTGESASIRLQRLTRIEGTVTLGDKPATSFVVELSGLSRRDKRVRDEQGKFTMHRVDPGPYKLKVRSDEGEAEAEIEVVAGKATRVTLNMEVLTRVRGKLVDEAGAPIGGALVTTVARRDDGEMNVMLGDEAEMTDSEGAFEVGVRPGKYVLLALRPGAGPLASRPLDVAEGESVIDVGIVQGKEGEDFGPEGSKPGGERP